MIARTLRNRNTTVSRPMVEEFAPFWTLLMAPAAYAAAIAEEASLNRYVQLTEGTNDMKHTAMILGAICALLGGLWLLQGLGIVHLRPILCFADCTTIQGPSLIWAVVGAVALIIGGFVIFWVPKQIKS